MTWRYIETPQYDTVTCIFAQEKVRLSFAASLGRNKTERPNLEGVLVS